MWNKLGRQNGSCKSDLYTLELRIRKYIMRRPQSKSLNSTFWLVIRAKFDLVYKNYYCDNDGKNWRLFRYYFFADGPFYCTCGCSKINKKSLAQEVRQKSDISESRSKGWRERILFTSPTVSLCDLSGVILQQKWI